MTISVVLPTHNEAGLDYLPRILERVGACEDTELVCVDNASTDGTAERLVHAEAAGQLRHLILPDSNRAQRLNAGVAAASHDRVLLHHPRSLLDPDALPALAALDPAVAWGGFTHAFDRHHPVLAWTSYYSNRIRHDRRGIVYLDHCIFLDRGVFGPRPVPDLDIFEDTALSVALRRHAPPVRLPQRAVTSAVRYGRNGVWRQATMNQVLKVGYAAGLDPMWMNSLYERGLGLNNHTNDDPRQTPGRRQP